jgi:hypothetical protein
MKPFNPKLRIFNLGVGCLLALMSPELIYANPVEQIGLKQGSIHKIGIGLGVVKFQILKIGGEGWICVECMEPNNLGWIRGDKYWVNTANILFISAPFLPAPKDGSIIPKKTPTPTKPKAK